jgi:Raf kinase inhibitor-like YbhB/YbcL family protein
MMILSSAAFKESEQIPQKYGKEGGNVSLPLTWTGAPGETKSFALAVVDRIAPGNVYLHWLVCDIPRTATALDEGASGTARMPAGAKEVRPYVGPFPPSGTHTYEFTLYALGTERLDLPSGTSLERFERAVAGSTLGTATLSGRFTKKRT